jgi:N-acetylmuramoyl-L-alanine amidase
MAGRHAEDTVGRQVWRKLVAGVRLALIVLLAALALLGLAETPLVAGLLGRAPEEPPLVGLVAGHWQNDSGAVCADGLQEVEINLEIARRTAYLLRQKGYRVEVLPEYSPKLEGYRAAVFLAIHCDSCVANLSGFKVARLTNAAVPEDEDELVRLLSAAYAQATGLVFHAETITEDMRQYHALRRIAPETPGAIIELGFMGGDRRLLTQEQWRVARGLAEGLLAFLQRPSR